MKKPHHDSRTKTSPQDSEKRNSDSQETAPESSKNGGTRETVESIAIAFVLAFLFRAFEAEAFVIPTGSMALTLYGRHKDVTCEKCGYRFSVGASDEVDNSGLLVSRIETALCPNCRFENDARDLPVFNGDRILVNKFPYEFGKPHRWDVAVFKYPEEPKTNYIKRIAGLPGETIVIRRGDLHRRRPDGELEMLRKDDPNKQKELQLLVYDNDFPEKELIDHGWPHRWAAVERLTDRSPASDEEPIAGWSETDAGWVEDVDARAFRLEGERAQQNVFHWLRYRHITPTPRDWGAIAPESETFSGYRPELEQHPRPQLITDLCEYNAYTGGHDGRLYRDYYWVGELTLSCDVELKEVHDDAELMFELNEGSRRCRCRIDLTTGTARLTLLSGLSRDTEDETELATAATPVGDKRSFRITFANVDNRLCLWIDNALVDFGPGAEYEVPETADPSPQDDDLIPAGIAARGAGLIVNHLLLERDIYYRSEHVVGNGFSEYPETELESTAEMGLKELVDNPQAWYARYQSGMQTAEFELGADEYLMLGDNSPRSKDSRLWSNMRHAVHRYAVPGSAFVGKAFFVYWPHGRPFLNDGNGVPITYHKQRDYSFYETQRATKTNYPDFRIPFYPQIDRMHRIR